MNDIPASRRLLNITKGLFDSCEEECTRLSTLNAELVAALEGALEYHTTFMNADKAVLIWLAVHAALAKAERYKRGTKAKT